MENEMEEIIQENSPDMLESEETMEIPVQDNLSDTEIVEEIQMPSDNLPENEITGDSSLIGESEQETIENTEPGTISPVIEDINTEESVAEDSGQVLEEDSKEAEYESLSGNSIQPGDSSSGSTYYVTNVYEIVEEQASPLWDSSFHDMSAEALLLCMIFLLLLVQFIHSFFKGSHWFK